MVSTLLKGYFYFLRLFLKSAHQKYPLKHGLKLSCFKGYFQPLRLFVALWGFEKIALKYSLGIVKFEIITNLFRKSKVCHRAFLNVGDLNPGQQSGVHKSWRVPNPPGANPLVAERAFPTSDYWGRTGVARCAEEMTQESVGISNRLLTKTAKTPRGPFSYQGVSTRGVRHSPERDGFPKGWFWRMFPRHENRNEGTFACSPGTKTRTRVAIGPAPHRVSRTLRARNPGRVRKESGKSTRGRTQSKARLSDSFRTLLRLRGALFRHFWDPAPGALSGLFSDSSGVPGPKGPGDPVWAGLSIRNEIFNRQWFSHSGPLSGRRKTGPGIGIFNREWKFQTENENFVRGGMPRGPGEASWCREAKIAARQFLLLDCRAITLTVGAILKRRKNSFLWEGGNLRGILRGIWVRVIASQKSPRDSGESIFAARHQDASQGPLGGFFHAFEREWIFSIPGPSRTFYETALLSPTYHTLRAQRLKKFKIALRDWNFQARLNISSSHPPKPLFFFVGNSEGPGLNISSEIDFSIEIDFFQSLGP